MPVQVHQRHANAGMLEGDPKLCLTLSQGLLGLLAHGRVLEDREQMRTSVIMKKRAMHLHRHDGSVLADRPALAVEWLGFPDLFHKRPEKRKGVSMNESLRFETDE